ncbi:hypothetical protein V6N13_004831 [Hibiscus sabdariffa]
MEVPFSGSKFTWKHDSLLQRLDRVLSNSDWLACFPDTHSHEDFDSFLSANWDSNKSVSANIEELKPKLSNWNQNVFGHIGRKKNELLRRIRGIDKALQSSHSKYLIDLDRKLRDELDMILIQEESLWIQKSRCQWYLHGDCNTKFFHSYAVARRRANSVRALKDSQGVWISDPVELQNLAKLFYMNLFCSDGGNVSNFPVRGYFPSLQQSDLDCMVLPISNEEVRRVVFSMGPLKAHGADGFHALF